MWILVCLVRKTLGGCDIEREGEGEREKFYRLTRLGGKNLDGSESEPIGPYSIFDNQEVTEEGRDDGKDPNHGPLRQRHTFLLPLYGYWLAW